MWRPVLKEMKKEENEKKKKKESKEENEGESGDKAGAPPAMWRSGWTAWHRQKAQLSRAHLNSGNNAEPWRPA